MHPRALRHLLETRLATGDLSDIDPQAPGLGRGIVSAGRPRHQPGS